jgi:signal transduction histidine kinase
LGLAHDIGKQMAWLQVLARRSCAGFYSGLDVGRDLKSIGELADDVSGRLQQFLDAERADISTWVSLDEAARAAISRVERLRGKGRIVQVESRVWSCCEVPQALEIVLENLLDNAVLASSRGRTVQLLIERRAAEIRIGVTDQGKGMDRDVRARAFHYGFSTRKTSGAQGLGLAVSREIVSGLGGRLQLDSVLGRGTSVFVHLPLEAGQAVRILQLGWR